MREFRSELPALIHARGIEIEPLTITVKTNFYYKNYPKWHLIVRIKKDLSEPIQKFVFFRLVTTS